jgi:hypothetical protein
MHNIYMVDGTLINCYRNRVNNDDEWWLNWYTQDRTRVSAYIARLIMRDSKLQ